jgi:hypothetical protein
MRNLCFHVKELFCIFAASTKGVLSVQDLALAVNFTHIIQEVHLDCAVGCCSPKEVSVANIPVALMGRLPQLLPCGRLVTLAKASLFGIRKVAGNNNASKCATVSTTMW